MPTAKGNATGDSTEATAVRQRNNGLGHRSRHPRRQSGGQGYQHRTAEGGVETTITHALTFAEVLDALSRIGASDSSEVTKLAIEFLTHTACRSAEMRSATWAELNVENGIWTIPGSRMKKGRSYRVPLSLAVIALLQGAREYADSSGLAFLSTSGRMPSDSK